MEIQQPSSPVDFDFNHGRASPCSGSPSTPKGFKEFSFFSVPPSPARASEFYDDFDDFAFAPIPESDILRQSETIKSPLLSPISSPSPTVTRKSPVKRSFWTPFSPKRRKEPKPETTEVKTEQTRGRERVYAGSSSRSGRRELRSLSPQRVSKYPWEEQQQQQQQKQQSEIPPSPSSSTTSSKPSNAATASIVPVKGSRKWRLKDLLLFRSASEGRAYEKDPLKKYVDLYKRYESGKGHVSPHELHYTVNKKISDDMKKKSFLPYKQTILGRLAFNPTFMR